MFRLSEVAEGVQRLWTCGRKVRHPTRLAAELALVKMLADPSTEGKDQLGWYHCLYCGGYHLGRTNRVNGDARGTS